MTQKSKVRAKVENLTKKMKFDENGSQKCLIPYCWAKSDFWRPFSKVVKTLFWSTVWKRPFSLKKRHRWSKVFKLCFDSKTMSKQCFGVHKLIWLVFFWSFGVAFHTFSSFWHEKSILASRLRKSHTVCKFWCKHCSLIENVQRLIFKTKTVFHHKFVISCQLTCFGQLCSFIDVFDITSCKLSYKRWIFHDEV